MEAADVFSPVVVLGALGWPWSDVGDEGGAGGVVIHLRRLLEA